MTPLYKNNYKLLIILNCSLTDIKLQDAKGAMRLRPGLCGLVGDALVCEARRGLF